MKDEILKLRDTLLAQINMEFDALIARLNGSSEDIEPTVYERTLPLTATPSIFRNTKPKAVLFGEDRVEVKTWTNVYTAVLKRCNDDPLYHERLINLRGRAAGKVRAFLASSPAGMVRPSMIDEHLYGETHYGSETLMHIMVNRILAPVGFDCSHISVILR
jgi:hypothetical protein